MIHSIYERNCIFSSYLIELKIHRTQHQSHYLYTYQIFGSLSIRNIRLSDQIFVLQIHDFNSLVAGINDNFG